jgi:FKBP-type peptidyl-prolyl cis-trans isomerase
VKTPSGLLFKIMVPSNGRIALAGDTVSVLYLGSLVNGKVFDASQHNIPFSFVLGAGTVIKGWDEGVAGMRIGETRKLIIPPNLGYGATGNASIPPNSTLIFMVRLLNIQ